MVLTHVFVHKRMFCNILFAKAINILTIMMLAVVNSQTHFFIRLISDYFAFFFCQTTWFISVYNNVVSDFSKFFLGNFTFVTLHIAGDLAALIADFHSMFFVVTVTVLK